MKLRTKFLASIVAVLLALTTATLLVVKFICETQVRKLVLDDLNSSVLAFKTFELRRESQVKRAAELIALQPSVRALMTTRDPRTIQDGSSELPGILGSDLLILCDRDGSMMAFHTSEPGLKAEFVQDWLRQFLANPGNHKWWLVDGHLFEVFAQSIYFGTTSDRHLLGVLAVGYAIDDQVASDVATIAASQVVFQYDNEIAASTFSDGALQQFRAAALESPIASDSTIGQEHFLRTSLSLSNGQSVQLVVFKSLDEATQFIRAIDRILVGLGIAAVVIGCGLVFAIFRRFTKPLDGLLAGVEALQKQEFDYPLDSSGRDEFATLTRAFDRMRHGLLRAQEELLESARLATIGRMASSISHDLRHRLTAVVANAEFLASQSVTPSQRQQFYAQIHTAVHSMTDLLESMVELSRGPESLRVEFISIRIIVVRAVLAVKTQPRFQDFAIDLDCDENIRGWLDPKKLEMALFNLVLNACEAAPKELPRIQIDCSEDDDQVEIRVTDNGPGVPESIRNTLFQPFVSSGKQNGSGLGLAIVQKCCQDHCGKVLLEHSGAGRTTFQIVLPLDDKQMRLSHPRLSAMTPQGATHEV